MHVSWLVLLVIRMHDFKIHILYDKNEEK